MKIVIAGSRDIECFGSVINAMKESGYDEKATCIISGGAKGVDILGEFYAQLKGLKVEVYKPDYNLHGRSAPIIRNKVMATNADAAVLIWDGKSMGTKNMIEQMETLGKPYHIHYVDE